MHIHLGLQGDFTEGSGPLPPIKGALRLRMWNAAAVKKPAIPGESKRHAWYSEDDGTGHLEPEQIAWIELRGPMDCSLYTQEKWEELTHRLGPDPLNQDSPEKMIVKARKSRKSIGELLMDQTLFAGVGNIFRAELLYRARLNPFRAGKDVPEQALRSIWNDAVALMPEAMIDRRIITTKPMDRPHRQGQALKEEAHYVYRRNGLPCFVCESIVKKQEVAGRNLFWCPTCQAD